MLRYWIEKTAVQNALLWAFLGLMVYYWGWVFDFGYQFTWDVLYTQNETYGEVLGLYIIKGLWVTVKVSCISGLIGLTLGTALGLARLSDFAPLNLTATCFVEFFRNTPLLVQLFFWYFALPMAMPEGLREWLFSLDFEFWTAAVAIGVYTSSFMAEVIRAGLQSIPKGLLEAAYSSGLNYVQVLRKIILPLAFREIIPPLGSEFLNNMKNTSLAMAIGVAEMTWQSQQVESLTFKGFEATTAASAGYLALSLLIAFFLNGINGKLRLDAGNKRAPSVVFVNMLSVPFVLLERTLFSPVGRVLRERKRRRPDAHTHSDTRVYVTMLCKKCIALCILGGKALFLAMLAGLLFLCIRGLLGFDWSVVLNNLRPLLIWQFPNGGSDDLFMGLGGFSSSVLIAVVAIVASFVIGLVIGLGRCATNRIFRIPCLLYIEIVRGNPLIIVIFWVYFFIPVLFNTFFSTFWSACIALTLFTAAYLAEIIRAGIQNLPPGQVEAAYSSGLSYWQTMRKIILPQALKQMIPPIVNLFIAIFKDTSLVFVLGVLELTFVAQSINNRLMVHPFEIWTTVAVLYLVPCLCMSKYAARLEDRLSPEKVTLKM